MVNLDTGETLLVEAIEETDVEAVKAFVLEMVKAFALEVIVTDETESYASAVADAVAREEAEARRTVAHRLCAAHFRGSKGRRLRHIAEEALVRGYPLLAMEARALRVLLQSPPEGFDNCWSGCLLPVLVGIPSWEGGRRRLWPIECGWWLWRCGRRRLR